MIYHLSKDDLAKVQELLKQFDRNVETAAKLNEILDSHKPLLPKEASRIAIELDESEYANNPYYRTVKPKTKKDGRIEISYETFKAYEPFLLDEVSVSGEYFKEKSPLGYFRKGFPYLAIKENGTIWMSVIPHEINTMKEPISKARGNVLLYGLGLGYCAFMMLQKPEVKSVTIVEKSASIKNLFEQHIQPFFPKGKTVRIVLADALKIDPKSLGEFDYVFADLWQQPDEGLELYLRLKGKLASAGVSADFWIEESMLILLRRAVLIMIDEELNYGRKEFENGSSFEEYLIAKIHRILKPKIIRNYNDLARVLERRNLSILSSNLFR